MLSQNLFLKFKWTNVLKTPCIPKATVQRCSKSMNRGGLTGKMKCTCTLCHLLITVDIDIISLQTFNIFLMLMLIQRELRCVTLL